MYAMETFAQLVDVETGMLRAANVKVVDADIEGREDQ
jgi:hypothetical protein